MLEQAIKEIQVTQDLQDRQVLKDLLVIRDRQVLLDLLVVMDPLDRTDLLDLPVAQEILDLRVTQVVQEQQPDSEHLLWLPDL